MTDNPFGNGDKNLQFHAGYQVDSETGEKT